MSGNEKKIIMIAVGVSLIVVLIASLVSYSQGKKSVTTDCNYPSECKKSEYLNISNLRNEYGLSPIKNECRRERMNDPDICNYAEQCKNRSYVTPDVINNLYPNSGDKNSFCNTPENRNAYCDSPDVVDVVCSTNANKNRFCNYVSHCAQNYSGCGTGTINISYPTDQAKATFIKTFFDSNQIRDNLCSETGIANNTGFITNARINNLYNNRQAKNNLISSIYGDRDDRATEICFNDIPVRNTVFSMAPYVTTYRAYFQGEDIQDTDSFFSFTIYDLGNRGYHPDGPTGARDTMNLDCLISSGEQPLFLKYKPNGRYRTNISSYKIESNLSPPTIIRHTGMVFRKTINWNFCGEDRQVEIQINLQPSNNNVSFSGNNGVVGRGGCAVGQNTAYYGTKETITSVVVAQRKN